MVSNTKQPFISVIIPVYNIMDYLPRCVDSVCGQTYENLEILLVDDGSTDGTGALCDELAAKDERIRVFHKENGGSSSARNLGIAHAKGSFLGFVDSDDYIEADMYERLVQALSERDCLIAQVGRDELAEDGKRLPDICNPPKEMYVYSAAEFLRELLLHKGDCSFCTKLVHRSLFDGQRFPEGVLNEDFHLLVHMLGAAGGVASLPGYGYHVFYRVGSNTRKADKEDFPRVYGDCVDNADMVYGMVKESYPKLKKEALRFGIFQRLEYLLHIPVSRMQHKDKQYRDCVSFLRKHFFGGMFSPYLTRKNKRNLMMLAIAPKTSRKLHRVLQQRKTGK